MTWRVLPCGEHALLIELGGLDDVLALHGAVQSALDAGDEALADVADVVPGARTLLVVGREGADLAPLRTTLPDLAERCSAREAARAPGEGSPLLVEIRVHYDGPDLREVAEVTGLRPEEVVSAHTETLWRAAFAGFAPGFTYLANGDPRLQVPRRSEPRTSVPAGAVGLAGEFSAVYPRSSPGGWQLLGHTEATLWDVDREPPALIQPGSMVHFVDADRAGAR